MFEQVLDPTGHLWLSVLVSLVPMAWTLANIWHHAMRDLVLVGEAVTIHELEYEAGQRAERV